MLIAMLSLGCSSEIMEIDLAYGHEMGSDTTEQSEPLDCMAVSPGDYGRSELDHIFGALVFQMDPSLQTFQSVEAFTSLGMNTVSLRFFLPFDEFGEVHYPYRVQGQEFQSFDHHLCFMGNLVHGFKEAGLSVVLSGEPHFYDKDVWMDLFPDWDTSDHMPDIDLLGRDVVDNFKREALQAMEAISALSETYQVDIVSPISEADRFFGAEESSDFMQDALGAFGGFNGKRLWQIYGEALLEPGPLEDDGRVDLSGYDIAGLSIIGCDMVPSPWERYIDSIVEWAQEDAVPEVAISEMGCVMVPGSVEDAEANFSYWSEKTRPYSIGLILLDTPQSSEDKQGVMGTWIEDWARVYAEENGLL
jgi:hypothetical protein